jgi:beta-glucosidase
MIEAILNFPPGFFWGTATSAHQVEGGNKGNDWWEWESQPGKILQGHRSENACEWWEGRWKEDFDRAKSGNQNSHRLSIEWSRIEPSPGKWDDDALDHYREILKGAQKRGLTPFVTLHHFTNPQWFADHGGWRNPETSTLYERYVRKVVSSLKDFVNIWVTINEPNVFLYSGYINGSFPPGLRDMGAAFEVARNIIISHAAAYHAIHEIQPDASVGFAHHFRGMQPSQRISPLHRWITNLRMSTFNDLFPRAAQNGWMRMLGKKISVPEAARTQDFFGLNYYTTESVHLDLLNPKELFTRGDFVPDADLSPSGFIANEPEGMFKGLQYAKGFNLPIIVTENGIEDASDELRPRYIAEHLRQVWAAASFNWKIQGYFYWTLVDNFEWERGWSQRFGLWALDPESQIRSKRPSADFYADICRANALSSESVARYAPEVVDKLFPPDNQREFVLQRGA